MTAEETLRATFKFFNKLMVLLWRLGLGPWINASPDTGGRIMVLTTIGRKSGQKRRAPVNYARVNGDVYCLAGFGQKTHWFRNLLANPDVEVWLPDGWWTGHAEEVTDPEEQLHLVRRILMNSGFAAEAFEAIDPHSISDEELREHSADWPVVHIRLEQALNGRGGPGDLAWLWPVAGTLALAAWWWRRRKS